MSYKEQVIEILRKQLDVLSEKSQENDVSFEELMRLSGEIDRIASTILRVDLE